MHGIVKNRKYFTPLTLRAFVIHQYIIETKMVLVKVALESGRRSNLEQAVKAGKAVRNLPTELLFKCSEKRSQLIHSINAS